MTITTYWKLKADVDDQYIDADGNEYANVLREVHWRCFASDGESEMSVYGSKSLPLPTNPKTYIDLSMITDQPDEQRRATILGWAEMVDPGFVEATEAKVTAALEAKLSAPVIETIQIL